MTKKEHKMKLLVRLGIGIAFLFIAWICMGIHDQLGQENKTIGSIAIQSGASDPYKDETIIRNQKTRRILFPLCIVSGLVGILFTGISPIVYWLNKDEIEAQRNEPTKQALQ